MLSECNITKASMAVTSLSLFERDHGELAVSWLRSLCVSELLLSSLHLYLPGGLSTRLGFVQFWKMPDQTETSKKTERN